MLAFDSAVLAATAAVDDMFGEDFVVRPYMRAANPNAPEVPDPTRDVVRLKGVWRTKAANPHEPNAYDTREWRRPGTMGDMPHVEFSTAATACLVGFEIRDGDHIERCSNGVTYRALTPTISPSGTFSVRVNRLGATA
jgi:hypothetical protein